MAKILIIDDERSIRVTLETWLTIRGHQVETCGTLEEGLKARSRIGFHVVFLDVFLQGEDGLQWFAERSPFAPPVIVISGNADLPLAVNAVKKGAFDFLEKPLSQEKLLSALDRALEVSQLKSAVTALKDDWFSTNFVEGRSAAMAEVVRQLKKAAPSPLSILIEGPSGSGKEGLAQGIHRLSRVCGGPFVAVNCAAIPASLFESELFGYKKGSFTGAETNRRGLFHQADGGTLFLDEVGEIPLDFQAKLLRALEQGEIVPLGSEKMEKVQVRILAATNRDLSAQCQRGLFREDLYFRLNQFSLRIPGLENRREDILPLVNFFQKDFAKKMGQTLSFSPKALTYLENRSYKGNIRELRAVVERALVLCGGTVELSDLVSMENGSRNKPEESIFFQTIPLGEAKNQLEKKYLETQLKKYQGRKTELASALGIHPNNLYRKLKDLEIDAS